MMPELSHVPLGRCRGPWRQRRHRTTHRACERSFVFGRDCRYPKWMSPPGRAAAGAQPLPLRIPDPPRVARSTHSRLIFFFERRRLRGLHLGGPGGPDARVTHENFDGRCCAGGPAPILSARPGPGGRLGSSRFRPLDVSAAAKPDAVCAHRALGAPRDPEEVVKGRPDGARAAPHARYAQPTSWIDDKSSWSVYTRARTRGSPRTARRTSKSG